MIKGIIFDMDGVLFDTEKLSTYCWMEVGKALSIDLTFSFINSFKGCTAKISEVLFQVRFGKDFDYKSAREMRTQFMLDSIEQNGVPVKKGLFELMDYLKENEIKSALATSSERKYAELYLKKTGVDAYIKDMITADDIRQSKPNPEIFIKARELLGVENENCFVIEDSPAGISAGAAAGIRVIHIPDQIEIDHIVKKRTYRICNNLAEVIQIIKNENTKKDR